MWPPVKTPKSCQALQGQMPLNSLLIEDRPIHVAEGNKVSILQSWPHPHKPGKDLEGFIYFLISLPDLKLLSVFKAMGLHLWVNLKPCYPLPFSCILLARTSMVTCPKEEFPSQEPTVVTLDGVGPSAWWKEQTTTAWPLFFIFPKPGNSNCKCRYVQWEVVSNF